MNNSKKYYSGLDLLKYLLAFLILDLHLKPLVDISKSVSVWLYNTVDRIAVPTFFLVGGYLFYSKNVDCGVSKDSVLKFVKRNFILYCAWTVIYLPLIIRDFMVNEKYASMSIFLEFAIFCRRFFLIASWTPLWFFMSGAYGMLIFFALWKKSRSLEITLLITFVVTNIFSIFEDCYSPVGEWIRAKSLLIDYIAQTYPTILGTFTQNSSWAAFYYCLGAYLVQLFEENDIKGKRRILIGIICFFVGGILLFCEVGFLQKKGANTFSRMNSLVLISVGLVMIFSEMNPMGERPGEYLRKMSIIIYGVHTILAYIFVNVLKVDSLRLWGIVTCCSIVVGMLVIKCSEKIKLFRLLF